MCSLHTRIAKKYNAEFESLRGEMLTECSDDNYYRLKVVKQKASDECLTLAGCASAEKFLKYLRGPTPPKRNLPMVQNHLDEMIKMIR